MADGKAEHIDALRPLLSYPGKVTRVGGVGPGQLTKITYQIIVAGM